MEIKKDSDCYVCMQMSYCLKNKTDCRVFTAIRSHLFSNDNIKIRVKITTS